MYVCEVVVGLGWDRPWALPKNFGKFKWNESMHIWMVGYTQWHPFITTCSQWLWWDQEFLMIFIEYCLYCVLLVITLIRFSNVALNRGWYSRLSIIRAPIIRTVDYPNAWMPPCFWQHGRETFRSLEFCYRIKQRCYWNDFSRMLQHLFQPVWDLNHDL